MRQTKFVLLLMTIGLTALTGCSKKFKMSRDFLAESSPWPYHRMNPESTAALPGTFTGKLNVVWEQSTGTLPSGPLTMSNGLLVYPGSKKKIKIYSPTDGSSLGYLRTKGHTPTGMVIQDSLGVYVDGPKRTVLHCMNLLRRKTIWEKQIGDAAAGIVILNEKIILSQTRGVVASFDLRTGDSKWTFRLEERLIAPPTIAGNRIYQPSDKGTLYTIDAEKGMKIGTLELKNPILSITAVGENTIVTDMPGNVYAISAAGDSVIWKSSVTGPVWSSPAVSSGKVFVTSNASTLTALNSQTGETIWTFDATEVIKSSPIVVGNYVIFGTMLGKLYAINSANGQLVSKRELAGAISQSPVSDGRFIYVASDHGELVCLGDTAALALNQDK